MSEFRKVVSQTSQVQPVQTQSKPNTVSKRKSSNPKETTAKINRSSNAKQCRSGEKVESEVKNQKRVTKNPPQLSHSPTRVDETLCPNEKTTFPARFPTGVFGCVLCSLCLTSCCRSLLLVWFLLLQSIQWRMDVLFASFTRQLTVFSTL